MYHFSTALLFSITLLLTAEVCTAQSPTISTIAGNGTASYSGEAVSATGPINHPGQVVLDGAGNVYFTEYGGQRVRKITTAGIITTIAGTGVTGFSGDGGPATAAKLNNPYGIDIDAAGNIYFTDCTNQRIRKINTSGIITTIAGTGTAGYSGDGGPATSAQVWTPNYLRLDPLGNIYFTDNQNHRIRKINTSGVVTTVVGTGIIGYTGDAGPATAARINYPAGIWIDNTGNLFVCDFANHVIRKVNPSGIISTIAGNGIAGSIGDGGAATAARLYKPQDIMQDAAGNLFIADTWNNKIRKINTSGVIATIAGTGVGTYSGDGGPATAAQINMPAGVYVNSIGNIFIADVFNHRIRKIGAPMNSIPYFTKGASQDLLLCTVESSAPSPIDTFLPVIDIDVAQTLTWGIVTPPAHGTLSGSYTASSTGGTVTPSGYTYLPTVGYIGTDIFKVSVNDGSAYDTITINVTVNIPPTAGTISGADSVCPGDTLVFSDTVSGGTWNTSIATIATVGSTGIVTAGTPGLATVSYTVTNVCGTAVATHPVFVKPYTECTSYIENTVRQEMLSIYPNPNKGYCIVTVQLLAKDAHLTLVDVYGRIVKEMNVLNNTPNYLLLDIPNGVYQLRVTYDNQDLTSKLIVNK